MTTVTAGSTGTYTFSASYNSVSITLDGAERAHVLVVSSAGALKCNDNIQTSRTLGPFAVGDVMTLTAIGGSVDFTAVDSSQASEALTYNPATGLPSGESGDAIRSALLGSGVVGVVVTVKSWAEVQVANNALALLSTGGTILFDPAVTYVVPAAGGVSIDTSFVSIAFGRALIDISGMNDGDAAFTFYSSKAVHDYSGYPATGTQRKYSDAYIYGGNPTTRPYSTDTQKQVIAFRFDSTADDTSNRIVFENPVSIGCYKAWSVKSRSYVVRVNGGSTTRCRYGVFMETGATDFAEIFGFRDHMFAENGIHLFDVGGVGNIWRFNYCHFDYHIDRAMEIQGSHVTADGCHFEWRAGDTAGETQCPFKFTSAGGRLFIKGGVVAFQDKNASPNWNPYYPGIFDMSDNSQVLEIDDSVLVNLGRRNDTASLDALVYVSATGVIPQVKVKAHSTVVNLNDLPSMTMYVDVASGFCVGGVLRNADTPFNELGWRTSVTGTAAISSVTTDENGVTRKNGQSMMKITGQGKVTIAFPLTEFTRRHCWVCGTVRYST